MGRSKPANDNVRPPTSRHARLLVLSSICLVLWGCGGRSTATRDDPLSVEDVLAELASIPRPVDDFFRAVSSRQSYYGNYGGKWQSNASRDKRDIESVVAGDARDPNSEVRWALGYGRGDTQAIAALMSWDRYSSGPFGVHVTAHWMLYLGKDDVIIGYAVTLYGDEEKKRKLPAKNDMGAARSGQKQSAPAPGQASTG